MEGRKLSYRWGYPGFAVSLLCRAVGPTWEIEWEGEPSPPAPPEETVTYVWHVGLNSGTSLLAAICFFCYLYAPVAYELRGDRLIVRFRRGEKECSPVRQCSTLTERLPFALRLWGNGGLFAATGIFWNRALGVFRAYLTSCRYQDMVLVATDRQKIVISPEAPEEFVKAWGGQAS